VVARCRGQGLNLSADELDLIDAWFAGGNIAQPAAQAAPAARATAARGSQTASTPAASSRQGSPPISLPTPSPAPAAASAGGRWWASDGAGADPSTEAATAETVAAAPAAGKDEAAPGDEFPRFVRNRVRG